MSSWYSQLLTTTSTRLTNLQRTLLAGESDGDTEDDTHVCRVLRAYYTEKGRPFPNWLPPDPKAPPPAAPVYAQAAPAVGSRYGAVVNQPGGGLSSLWDNNNNKSSNNQPASLRAGGRGAPSMPAPDQSRNLFAGPAGGRTDLRDDVQARPLPSQRAGSYQQTNLYGRGNSDGGAAPPSGGSASVVSAQDRLRQRLWGGARTASPAAGGPFQPPAQQQQQASNRYGGGGNQSIDDYESRFAPGNTYGAPGGGGGGGGDRPFMAANSPWASNENEYTGGGGTRSGGLPSGPKRGLPSGPRMR